MTLKEAAETASQCRHYAMCKIDFTGNGLCPSGRRNHFVSYWPQGLMDMASALFSGKISVTPGLIHAVAECSLCGLCEGQCHFVTGLRPLSVFRELKDYLGNELEVSETAEDDVLRKFREVTGERYATNDPSLLYAYADDPCPVSMETLPRYAVLPENTSQVSEIVRICRENDLHYSVRGNGSSVMGFVFSPGVVIDTVRMRRMDFDLKNRAVTVGAGISAFELQKESVSRGYRVNAAEPSALYCANIMCSGIFSLFSSSMGTGADNIIDARFVDPEGGVFTLSQRHSPNLFAFTREELPRPGICTEAVVRLYPIEDDESAIAVPFPDMGSAVSYAAMLNRRGIGLGIGVLGGEYLSTFTAPTAELARSMRGVFRNDMGIEYLVVILGNRHHLEAARELAPCVFDQELMTAFILGMTALAEGEIHEILRGLEGRKRPYEILSEPGMEVLVQAALDPSVKNLVSAVDGDMKDFYTHMYTKHDLTDMLYLNTFRSVSSRMGREGHVVAFILYVPLDDLEQIEGIHRSFSRIAEDCGVRGDFGFITPLDRGAMAVLEWDMYLDHTDPEQTASMQRAMGMAGEMIEEFSLKDPRVLWIRYLFNQGFARKESFLYHGARLS